ncbi:hypothetical protein, partial [Methylobacterium oryzae]|uniref:hypothetical protein n=1 Tax=Methylobacterium oryzae TaxID=334852 RepID=UPI002F2DF9C7
MARLGRLAGALALLGGIAGNPALAQTPLAQSLPTARTAPRPVTAVAAPFTRTFVRPDLASAAVRLETALKAEAGGPLRPAGQSRATGLALLAADKPDEALAPLTAAVAADPADGRNWQAYARGAAAALGALEDNDYQGRSRLRGRVTAAAY